MEREEGELTDEDLEDVSDNSSLSMLPIPMVLSGKSPSLSTNREPFRELSLTSVSEDSEDRGQRYRIVTTRSRDINQGIYRKRKCRGERKHSGTKRARKISERRVVRRRTSTLHKEYSSVSSSSDESDYYKQDKEILRQLRDAVRINRSQNLPNCSLRTRIKRMIEPDSQGSKNSNSEDENDLDTLRDLALQSKTKKESETPNVTDKDLIELRLIALQSAFLKKDQTRRKNKQEQQNKIIPEANVENSAENQHMKTDSSVKAQVIENNADIIETKQDTLQNTTDNSTEATNKIHNLNKNDDETILRAVLLSSISNQDNKNNSEDNSHTKTVTKKSNEEQEDEAMLRAMLLSSIYNNANSAHSNQENIQNNVDNNSNTCTTTQKTENTKSNIDEDEDILRAMLLANISKKIASKKTAKQANNALSRNNSNLINTDRIASKTVTNPSDTKNTVKVPSVPVNRFIINLNSDSDSDCDQKQTMIEKRKPEKAAKNNDLFDKSLSLFLQKARAQSDAEHKSDISHLPKSQQLEYRRLKRKLQQLTRSRLKTTAKTKKIFVSSDENNKLKLVNMNTKKEKSDPKSTLQSIPDQKQLNNKVERLQEKGKYEELGPLMAKVSDARVARDKAQAEVKKLINELRVARTELTTTHQTYTTLMQQLVTEKSLIDKRLDDQELEIKKLNNNTPVCTSTPNKVTLTEQPKDISCEISAINETVPAEDKSTNTHTIVPEIEDIDESPMEEEKKESTISKYSSPLDHIQLNREQPDSNPLSILCPYDLLGVCRDPDCSFRHCGNANPITD